MTSFTSSETKADTAELFTVPKEQLAHIQIVPAEKGPLPRTLRLSGAVAYDAFQTTPVFAAIGGPVREILVAPGEVVHAGQPLLTVTSPDYSAARSAYIKARDAYSLADKLYTRALDLFAHGAIAEADLQQAESNRTQAHADLESSADALRALGIKDPEALLKNPAQSTAEIPVPAPVTGEIVERLVGPGQLLQGGATQCFTISNTNTVWVLVNVFQSDLPYVHVGNLVEINTEAYPELFHGKIAYIASALDPNTRTLQARIVTENPEEKIEERHVRNRPGGRRLHSGRHHRSGRRRSARHRKSAVRVCADQYQPVRAPSGYFGPKQQGLHANHQRPEGRRARSRKRKPVPSIQEFATALRRELQNPR